MKATTVLLGLLVLAAGSPALAEAPPAGAVPFPVDKTTKLRAKDGPVFFIDGPTVIPKNVEITVQLDVSIVGINGASLDVQGGLKIHGTQDHWVKITNVDFSPTRTPKRGLHLDMVDMQGVKFVHSDEQGLEGDVVIENGTFQRDCAFDVRVIEGSLKLMTIESGIPWKIRCTPENPSRPGIEIGVRSCWARGIELTGPCEATFRHNELRGGLTCRDVTDVTVDGCDVWAGDLAFRQMAGATFKHLDLTKLNFFGGARLVLDRAADPDAKKEKVKLDKSYFGPKEGPGIVDKDAVAELVDDGEDVPERNVFVLVGKPQKRKHQLVAYEQLRLRVAPLR